MAAIKIEEVLEKIRSNPSRLRSCIKADSQTIQLYETAFDVILPDDYKMFLELTNGLDKIVLTEDAKHLWQQGDYEQASQLGNNILDIESVFEEFESVTINHWKIDADYDGPYPYIPFCQTGNNEKLVFGNQKLKADPSIYFAHHDEPASDWVIVAKNFTAFLDYFINTKGELPTDEVSETPSAEDLQHVSDEIIEKHNSSVEIIKSKTAYIKLFPKDTLSYILRANAYSDTGEYEKALNDFQVALDLEPRYAFAHYCRGAMLQKIKKFRQALTDIDTACQLEPDDLYSLSVRAELFHELNKPEKALADCNRIIEIDDRFILAYFTRRDIYLYQGEVDKAEKDIAMIDELIAEDE